MSRGFSLVELSIVLVILGLLTGGILAGQSLIRAAELRSVSNDYTRLVTAVGTFRDKYFALPGDMTNATKFWGAADADPATCRTSTNPGTCNGNGNGKIASISLGSDEHFRSWQHLANAGLIEGSYTGVTGTSHPNEHVLPGVNAPRSRINNAAFGWNGSLGVVTNPADTHYFVGNYSNPLQFGTSAPASYGPAIKPEEAWNIDTKLDDGLPHQGSVRSLKNASTINPGCAAASNVEYALTATGTLCSLTLITGY